MGGSELPISMMELLDTRGSSENQRQWKGGGLIGNVRFAITLTFLTKGRKGK